MKRFIEGEDRSQVALLSGCLDDFIAARRTRPPPSLKPSSSKRTLAQQDIPEQLFELLHPGTSTVN